MKKIGLIGGISTENTIEYYKLFTRKYNRIYGGISSPKLLIESLDYQEITDLIEKEDYEPLLDILETACKNLKNAGATVIAFAATPPHIVFNSLEERVECPIISIMEAVTDRVKKEGLKKVGLIGTSFTMIGGFYQKKFKELSLELITPTISEQEQIDTLYWEELVYQKSSQETKTTFREVIVNLIQKGAEGIIVGNTEMFSLLSQEQLDTHLFNAINIHVEKLLTVSLEE